VPNGQGIRPNLHQFLLLVLINAFVGAMVGMERSVLPLLASREFGLESEAAVVSFLISFGAAKVLGNLGAGGLADRYGRKRVLLAGWLFGLPVPLVVIFAQDWTWVVAANGLLGVNQGLCWSMTVVMKIDLAGTKRRGVATAANEWAGYLGVALAAAGTGFLAETYSVSAVPFYPGIALALTGLTLSLFTRETSPKGQQKECLRRSDKKNSFPEVFIRTSWSDRTLFGVSQAGLVTNLKDGLIWGLIPLYLSQKGLAAGRIGIVTAIYPLVWGFLQLAAGPASDRWGRKWMIASGMLLQGLGLALFAMSSVFWEWVATAALIGLGTALVYPTLLAAVSDRAGEAWRASALGVYRLWRDMGYVLAGVVIGSMAEFLGGQLTIFSVAGLSLLSFALVALLSKETRRPG
jgi:MFS family permease